MTLTQTAILTRNFIFFSIIVLVLSLTGTIGYKIWYTYYYLPSLPPVEEKPDTKFGVLPYPNFPTVDVSSSNYSYTLDTATGGFPDFEKIVKVYFIPQPFASLLSGDKSKALAKKFKITTEPEVISETEYLFKEGFVSLKVNLDSGNFVYQNEATKSGEEKLAAPDELLTQNFKDLLKTNNFLNDSLQNGRSKINFLKSEDGESKSVSSRSEAQIAQISLWPEDIDKNPIVTENPNSSLINALVKNTGRELSDYFEINYITWPIDLKTFATYPLKSSEKAFEDLQSGKGIVMVKPTRSKVSITSVYLSYYLSKNYTPYLQPVFVFEGPEFVAFVPAVANQFLEESK